MLVIEQQDSDRDRLQAALDASTGECADLWNSIREKERAAYDAGNSLDVAQLDAMALDLGRQVGELRAALDKAERERDEAREQLRIVSALAGEPTPYVRTYLTANAALEPVHPIPDSEVEA
jgi:hypothetical protein